MVFSFFFLCVYVSEQFLNAIADFLSLTGTTETVSFQIFFPRRQCPITRPRHVFPFSFFRLPKQETT